MMSLEDWMIVTLTAILISITIISNILISSLMQSRGGEEQITGRAATGEIRLTIVQQASYKGFSITLYEGKNWFSIPLRQDNTTVQYVLRHLGSGAGTEHEKWSLPGCTGNASDNYQGNYTIIWTYNASNTANPWQSYNPTKPCFQIPNEKLKHITREYNYEINMNATDVLHANGTEENITLIPLATGNNWVGYPSMKAKNVSEALATLGSGAGTEHEKWSLPGCTGNASDNYQGNYTIIWTYNASNTANPWQSYNPTKPCFQIPNEKLKQLTPGQGYQINMNASDTWIIDW